MLRGQRIIRDIVAAALHSRSHADAAMAAPDKGDTAS